MDHQGRSPFAFLMWLGFPGGSDGKESSCNAGGPGSIPGSGRSPGEGNGNPLQYSCLGNPMDRAAWWATVHGVTKSQTRLSDFTFTFLSECLIAVENGNPLQDSCLENCMHRGIWWATVHGVTKSGSQLSTRINTQCLKHGSCFKQNSAHII